MTRSKTRQLELAAGAPQRKGVRGIAGNKNAVTRAAEREHAQIAEAALGHGCEAAAGWNMTEHFPEPRSLPAGLALDGELGASKNGSHFPLLSRRLLNGDPPATAQSPS